jgi:hypothetical protein
MLIPQKDNTLHGLPEEIDSPNIHGTLMKSKYHWSLCLTRHNDLFVSPREPLTLEENYVFSTSVCNEILVARNILQLKSL